MSGPSRTFIFKGELSYRVRDFTRNSRFVLYDNGAFVLQYPPSSLGDGAFRGQYRDASGGIMFLFEFQGRTIFDPWDDAIGTLKGDSLTVQYEESMQHADFEDAVYLRTLLRSPLRPFCTSLRLAEVPNAAPLTNEQMDR